MKFRELRFNYLNVNVAACKERSPWVLELLQTPASTVPRSSPLTSLKLASENPSLRSIKVPSDLHRGRPLELAARMR